MKYTILLILLLVSACSRGNDVDYSRVRVIPDLDVGYKLPSVLGCTDEDLINC